MERVRVDRVQSLISEYLGSWTLKLSRATLWQKMQRPENRWLMQVGRGRQEQVGGLVGEEV